jgi:hypothetical protein
MCHLTVTISTRQVITIIFDEFVVLVPFRKASQNAVIDNSILTI